MPTALEFAIDSEPVVHLLQKDPALANLIRAVGTYRLELRDDRFVALARAIVGQQLSVSVARKIWARLVDLLEGVSPDTVNSVDFQQFRGVGLSNAKANYITDLARKVLDGTVDLDSLDLLTDQQIIDALTKIKGIGRWTAEMFLIFSLGRLDVFAVDDAGLQRSMRLMLGESEALDPLALDRRSQLWRPYRSIASLYLWEALDLGFFSPAASTTA